MIAHTPGHLRARAGAALLGLAALAGAAHAAEIYANDFSAPVGAEWSASQRNITPAASRWFLGEFLNDTVTLSLDNLPAHDALRVQFDLFIIRTWDGNFPPGPDQWFLNVDSDRVIDTTFAVGPVDSFRMQSYPTLMGGGAHAPRTGALENDTLGFVDAINRNPADSVYRFDLFVNHAAPGALLSFGARGLQDLADESWGLANIRVSAVPTPGAAALGALAVACALPRRRRPRA